MTPYVDMLDERLSGLFPRELPIDDATTLTVTPMVPSDWQCLERFLTQTPAEDRRFFRHNLPDASRVERWCSELDYHHVFPLLAWDGQQIVADAALIRDPELWTNHVGKIRLLVHPAYRGRGIGRLMLRQVIEVAQRLALRKLVHECAAPQDSLIEFLRSEGFREAARLEAFVQANDGSQHDLVLMVR